MTKKATFVLHPSFFYFRYFFLFSCYFFSDNSAFFALVWILEHPHSLTLATVTCLQSFIYSLQKIVFICECHQEYQVWDTRKNIKRTNPRNIFHNFEYFSFKKWFIIHSYSQECCVISFHNFFFRISYLIRCDECGLFKVSSCWPFQRLF